MTSDRVSHHGEWSGGFSFFLAATGAAVGLGNIWKFPYVAGEHGGGAFVLFYALFMLLIAVPIFMSEVMIGRRGRQSPYNSLYILASEETQSRRWAWLGGLVAIAGFTLLSYYSAVAGKVMAYTVRSFSGSFTSQSADGVESIYQGFIGNPEALLAWHTLFMVLTCIIVSRGVRHGLEKTVKFLLPALVSILLGLVVYSVYSDSFVNGASYLIDVDFKKFFFERDEAGLYIVNADGSHQFTFEGVLAAMGHAFFTLSVGVGAMMIFGSYLDRNVSIAKLSISIAVADTLIAVLAGLAIFPIVFSYGLAAEQGPGLVFTTLPVAFGGMVLGNVIGGAFYLLLFIAALTSAIALLEPSVTWLIERRGMRRVQATVWAGGACWLLGILSVFSVSGMTLRKLVFQVAEFLGMSDLDLRHRLFDLSLFKVIDSVVTLFILPLCGILIAVFAGWMMSKENSADELNIKRKFLYNTWQILIRYVAPVLVLVVFIAGLVGWLNKYVFYQPVL